MKNYLIIGASILILTLAMSNITTDPKLEKLYQAIIKSLGKLSFSQKNGIKAIYQAWVNYGGTDINKLSYIIATAYHESRFRPIKEIRGVPGSSLYAKQEKYWHTGYFGRGFVQLTWKANYEKMSKRLKLPALVTNPDLALDASIAARIMIVGMYEGLFSGKKLSDYINDTKIDFFSARRIVNVLDRATEIATYAESIQKEYTRLLNENTTV